MTDDSETRYYLLEHVILHFHNISEFLHDHGLAIPFSFLEDERYDVIKGTATRRANRHIWEMEESALSWTISTI